MAINNNPSQPAYLIPGLPSGMGASKGVGTDANGNLQSNVVREVLGANRTYYVATTGSDSNSGLSAGSPFLTIQKAINTIYTLDLNSYTVTVQLADGTYTAGMTFTKPIVGGNVQVVGNTTTPNNVVISVAAGNAIYITDYAYVLKFSGMTLTNGGTTSHNCLYAYQTNSSILLSKVNFGSSTGSHIYAFGNVLIANDTNVGYEISGGALRHVDMRNGAQFSFILGTVTITGTPAFSQFSYTVNGSGIYWFQPVFSGSATGQRYYAASLSMINTYGGGATFLPGSTAGAVDAATCGVYA